MAGIALFPSAARKRVPRTYTMKHKAVLLFVAAPLACAGEPDLAQPLPAKAEPWLTPIIDIRARYEIADVDGFDVSHAFTTRERLGLKTRDWNGLSFLVEGEFRTPVISNFTDWDDRKKPDLAGGTMEGGKPVSELGSKNGQYAQTA